MLAAGRLVKCGKGTLKAHVIKDILQETLAEASEQTAESMKSSALAKLIANTQDVVVVPPHVALQFRPNIGERWCEPWASCTHAVHAAPSSRVE